MSTLKNKIKEILGEENFAKIQSLISSHKFAEVIAKDGSTLSYEGELKEGTVLNVITAEGNKPAPDMIELEDGTIIECKDGVVTKITPFAAADEKPAEMEGLTPEVEKAIKDYVTDVANTIKGELQAQIDEMKAMMGEYKTQLPPSDLNEKVEKALSELLAAKQEFSSASSSDNDKLAKLNERFDGVVSILEKVLEMPVGTPKEETPAQKSKREQRISTLADSFKKIQNKN